MTCGEALRLWDFARPGATELDATDIAALETHLSECSSCQAFTRAERGFDERVVRALQAASPASSAREQLLSRLGSERRGWWWRRAAVAMGVVTSLAIGWQLIPGPRLDVEAVANLAWDQVGNRDGAVVWLAGIDRRFQFPPRFRGNYLVAYERRSFHNVTAPILTFAHGNSLARVAVVTSGQFRNLSSLPEGRVAENSACTIVVIRDANEPAVVYVVEVLNGPIEPYLSEDEISAT